LWLFATCQNIHDTSYNITITHEYHDTSYDNYHNYHDYHDNQLQFHNYHDYQSIANPPRLCRRPKLKVGKDLVSLIIAYSSVSCDVRQQLLETQGVVRAGTNVRTPSRLFMKLTFECKCYL